MGKDHKIFVRCSIEQAQVEDMRDSMNRQTYIQTATHTHNEMKGSLVLPTDPKYTINAT